MFTSLSFRSGKGIVRVDGLVRNNAGVAIGDTVIVRKIKVVAAEKVIVAPLEAIPPVDEQIPSRCLGESNLS